jgi:Holliday junction resolvase YEN1
VNTFSVAELIACLVLAHVSLHGVGTDNGYTRVSVTCRFSRHTLQCTCSLYVLLSLYQQLGSGKREALATLSLRARQKKGRPLRLAIDISIWLFQVESGQGGPNPALRTLYYRLQRLLALCIAPLFVFDGPDKPLKRHQKKVVGQGGSFLIAKAKRLMTLFGFQFIQAPGEAEAQCAILNKMGVVDAVLSEDVDTLMFGCPLMLRNMSGEGRSKTPTHVNVYCSEAIKKENRLDRQGMILIALLSGGDYFLAGIPKCGIKIACEIARAGFGTDLCSLCDDDEEGYHEWRERLRYELATNESGYFTSKHKALTIPDSFPDRKILGHYKAPTVTTPAGIDEISRTINWTAEPQIGELREFVASEFDWTEASGASKFIRGLAPALVPWCLVNDTKQTANMKRHVALAAKSNSLQRRHFDTGGVSELRLEIVPAGIVGIDLTKEVAVSDCDTVANGSDAEWEETQAGVQEEAIAVTSSTVRIFATYDPKKTERLWVSEDLIKSGLLEIWIAWKARSMDATHAQEDASTSKQGPITSYFKAVKSSTIQRPPEAIPKTTLAVTSVLSTTQTAKAQTRSNARKHPNTMAGICINPWTLASNDIIPKQQQVRKGPSRGDYTRMATNNRYQSDSHDDATTISKLNCPESQVSAIASYDSVSRSLSDIIQVDLNRNIVGSDARVPLPPAMNATPRKKRAKAKLSRSYTAPVSYPSRHGDYPETSSPRSDTALLIAEPEQRKSSTDYHESQYKGQRPLIDIQGMKASTKSVIISSVLDPASSAPVTTRQNVLLCESLEGSWRPYSDGERLPRTPRRFSSVDVIDLTKS